MSPTSVEPVAPCESALKSSSISRSMTDTYCCPRSPSLSTRNRSSSEMSRTWMRCPSASGSSRPVSGSARYDRVGCPLLSPGKVTTKRCPLRVHGPSSTWVWASPAMRRASEPSGRTTHTCVRTPPSVATAQVSQPLSAAQRTATTGSSESSMCRAGGGGPSSTTSCTHSCGMPERSLMKATCRASGVMLGPQLPQASTSSSASATASSTVPVDDLCRHRATSSIFCSHISRRASCHSAFEPRVVRVAVGLRAAWPPRRPGGTARAAWRRGR